MDEYVIDIKNRLVEYGAYTLLINLDNSIVSLYNSCCREEVSKDLPEGISWSDVHVILGKIKPAFSHKALESEKSLMEKIADFYFNKK